MVLFDDRPLKNHSSNNCNDWRGNSNIDGCGSSNCWRITNPQVRVYVITPPTSA
ncbi:MAG: hypothetical protein WA421_04255 [Nitrososphaeraceae archaeon]